MNQNLENAFGFNSDDLTENRVGRFSEKQLSRLITQQKRESLFRKIALFAFLVPVILFGGWAIYNLGFDLNKNLAPFLAIFGWAILVLGIFIFFMLLGMLRSDLRTRKVSTVTGLVVKQSKKMPRKSLGVAYYLQIDGVRFQLDTKKKFDSIFEGTKYQIYFVKHPPTQIILSLEEIKS